MVLPLDQMYILDLRLQVQCYDLMRYGPWRSVNMYYLWERRKKLGAEGEFR